MGVTYELIDGPYPYLCALFRCRCGAVGVQQADQLSTPPAGWEPTGGGGEDYRCPACAALARPAAPAG